jgi:tripartite-type tricarboxylate transporter receptor subunit TctC
VTPKRFVILAVAAAAMVHAGLAAAQSNAPADFPNRPIRLIVPFAAGGGVDLMARIAAKALGEELKQTVIVENKPGASGTVAAV